MGNVYMEASQINYRGGEKKMSVEEALKNTSGEAAAIAQIQQDVSDLNDVKANKITIAPAFSAEASYDPGDLVYYNGLTYRCVNAHSGEWDADDFAATTIDNELSELRSGLTIEESGDGSHLHIYKMSKMVAISGSVTLPYLVPAGYRPKSVVFTPCRYNNTLNYITIASDGTLKVGDDGYTTGSVIFSAAYATT